MSVVTFEDIVRSEKIRTYIRQADATLIALGFTEHSFTHVGKVAQEASFILSELGYSDHEVELARIAGYMHDIGNVINRDDHAQSGAVMAFRILDKLGMAPEDVAVVITAIGNHDEHTSYPVNAVAAALILADKTDVQRHRHDRDRCQRKAVAGPEHRRAQKRDQEHHDVIRAQHNGRNSQQAQQVLIHLHPAHTPLRCPQLGQKLLLMSRWPQSGQIQLSAGFLAPQLEQK